MKETKIFRLIAIGLLCSLFTFFVPHNTYAATMPQTSPSFYVSNPSTATSYTAGCNLGTSDKNSSFSGNKYVILSYGAPQYNGTNYGATMFSSTGFYTTRQIADSVDEFAHGYWSCTGTNTLAKIIIGVGTTNSRANVSSIFDQSSTVISNHGSTWSNMIGTISAEIYSKGWSSQASVQGAIDFEPGFAGGLTASRTWVDGFSGTPTRQYFVNFGSADGCPTSGTGTCTNGWSQGDLYYLSWGNASAFSFPQIYNTTESTLSNGTVTDTNAKQWYNISLWGVNNSANNKILFNGALSQNTACTQQPCVAGTNATPLKSWWYLWNALNADTRTATDPTYSSDIRWLN